MKAVVICGGTPPSEMLIREEIANSNVIICADSGANCLYTYKIIPHYLIGDFDSINEKVLKYFKENGVKIENFPPEKDFTDSYIALDKAIELGANELVLLGCTGSRIDHLLGNIGLLLRALNLELKASIKDDNNTIILIDSPIEVTKQDKKYLSLIPYSPLIKGLTIKGVKYELNRYNLELGSSLGISNEIKADRAEIVFDEGLLIVIFSKD